MGDDKFIPSLDRYARMVVRVARSPRGYVTVADRDQLRFPGVAGDHDPAIRTTPRARSFCELVIVSGEPLEVVDARLDSRVCDNLATTEDGVAAYLGYPLKNGAGKTIGTVCAVDSQPRDWTEGDHAAIQDLADATSSEIIRRELRLRLEMAWTVMAALLLVAILIALTVLS